MIIDKEEHREILKAAVENIPISGPAGHPEMLARVMQVHEVLAAINAATVPIDPTLKPTQTNDPSIHNGENAKGRGNPE